MVHHQVSPSQEVATIISRSGRGGPGGQRPWTGSGGAGRVWGCQEGGVSSG